MRLRRVLRLRRRDRRRAGSGSASKARCSCCLPQRLRLPRRADGARGRAQLDAFVTKTVTPLPRAGNAPVRIVETDGGMLNSIGLANPGRDAFLAETLPRLRELGVPLWVSVGGFAAREYAETCAQLDGRRGDRAQPLVPERRRGARVGRRDRRRLPGGDALPLYAKLSPAAGTSPRSPARSRRRARTGSRSSTRSAAWRSTASCARCSARAIGGFSGPALRPIALAAVYACRRGDRAADRRHGRR